MSQRERQRYHLLKLVIDKTITLLEASKKMSVSYRHAKRLKQKFLKGGAKNLIHGNRNKQSPKRIKKEIKDQILKLSYDKYKHFNNAHFTEKLNEIENIKISLSTVRRIRRSNNIKPKRKRRCKKHYGRRERKKREGLMMLWDGSPHRWFGKDKELCCLMASVDDATSKILDAFFIEYEGSFAYLKLLKNIVQKHGIPISVYQDKHSALKRNDNNWTLQEQLANRQRPTQVGAALDQLAIQAIFASSPQAKGKIGRLFGVLQDRLIAEIGVCQDSCPFY